MLQRAVSASLIVIFLECAPDTRAFLGPVRKVVITSVRASAAPSSNHPGYYLIQYEGNVAVDLSDNTRITGERLEALVRAPAALQQRNGERSVPAARAEEGRFKSVVMRGSVEIRHAGHEVKASTAEIDLKSKKCLARGNVTIVQKGEGSGHAPIVARSQRAELDLTSESLVLVGSLAEPVSTVIEFDSTKS